MTEQSGGMRLLPGLGVGLVLVLVAALALVLLQPGEAARGAAPVPGAAAFAEAHAAYRLAGGALRGDPAAFEALAGAESRLAAADLTGVDAENRRRLGQVQASLKTITSGRAELVGLRAAADRADRIFPALAGQIEALASSAGLRTQPAAIAQLERLRALSDGVRRELRGMSGGSVPAGAQGPALLDADMVMGRIVRGLGEGDTALGLSPVTGAAAVEALEALRQQVAALSKTLRDVLASGDRLGALQQSVAQLDSQIAGLPVAVVAGGRGAAATSLPAMVTAGLLAIGLALALGMVWIYKRLADTRRETARQTAQSERNQQAILTLLDEMSSLADGDLTVHATVTEDITGAIADSINYAIEALRELVTTINESAILVDGAAKQTESSARQLAAASEAQSKQLESASRAISRMASSIEEVSGNAERSSDVARHSVDVAHKGGDAVRRTIEGMNAIRETIQETSKRIKRLGESSQEIGNIVELINDIADQTNILALNAAIQASMAGEAGRGFAVVADEVQRLAERSANATKQLEVLVRTIQADTNEAIVPMERSTTDVGGGALLAENAGAALEEIEQVSNQIAALVQNISSSAREQGKAASAVTRGMDVLQEINSETAASTSATTSAISKLSELATQLRRSVAGFRLPPVTAIHRQGHAVAGADARQAGQKDDEPGAEPSVHAETSRFAEPVSFVSKRTA
ncbi:MAG: methyl-accepting chemotaxis protein [Gammaproteobacteria bacterium]|nr:methyl-accepting chemotaxis protein [Gammaproteobacteria bacterium]